MVRDPSLLCSHELVRTSFSPVSFSTRRFFHHLRVPAAPSIIVVAKASVASRRVVRDVFRNRERVSSRYFSTNTLMASSAAERRRVDCTPILEGSGRIQSLGIAPCRFGLKCALPWRVDSRFGGYRKGCDAVCDLAMRLRRFPGFYRSCFAALIPLKRFVL